MRNYRSLPVLFLLMVCISSSAEALKVTVVSDSVRYINPIFKKVDIQKDITFGEVNNSEGKTEKLLLDVYMPNGDIQSARPVIMWIHGGGFKAGNNKSQSYIVKMANEFAERGYVCISINYRVRNKPGDDKTGTMTDALEDAMAGLNWIRKNYEKLRIDKTKIIIGGGSAGGMLAVNLCYKDKTASGKWDKSGIIGLVDLWGSPDESWTISKVDKNDPPTIIVHGTADTLVPYINSQRLIKQLEINQVKHNLITIEGAGHTPTSYMDEFVKSIAKFLYGLIMGK
jgi:acetyl esterase/lipase